MTRKRARKILMAIGTSRNHANWGLTAKPRWKTNAGVVEDTLTITLYAKLLRKKMDEGKMRYTADFSYKFGGKLVVEDVKSKPTRTKEYLRNRKFMRSKFGIDIQEI